jgi:uncharacterized protein YdaU (DUF1376 family)
VAKSPAFRFYPADFMGSPDVQSMDLNEIGAFILLLCIAWQHDRHGYLPDDEDRIRRWARMNPQQWIISREMLLGKFPIIEPGFRGNPRMIREAEKQAEFSAKQSSNGKQGGRPRKAVGFENKPVASEMKANENPNPPEMKPSVLDSVSVFDSVSVSEDRSTTLALTPDGVYAGVFELPLIGKQGEWSVPKNFYQEMVKAYPGVDVMEQLAGMRGWLIANPTKRKTPAGLPKFINSWLSGAQNNQRGRGSNSHGDGKPSRIDMILESTREALNLHNDCGADRNALSIFNRTPFLKPTLADNIAAKQAVLDARQARRSREQQILESAQQCEEELIREAAMLGSPELESQTERKTDESQPDTTNWDLRRP